MNTMSDVCIIKKDGTLEPFDEQKIVAAVTKSAARVMYKFKAEEYDRIVEWVKSHLLESELKNVPIQTMHNLVESALEDIKPDVAKSYRDYRNYKIDFVKMLDDVYRKAQNIMYIGDKENSNTDSALVATKRSLIYNQLNKELYKKFFLTNDEKQAINDGYIYIHDMSARRDTMNCCLFDMGKVLKGGFEMGNLWYNEPNSLAVAFDVIGDVVLSTASQQYGGFTVPEIDKILAPYAEKSYAKYYNEIKTIMEDMKGNVLSLDDLKYIEQKAMKKICCRMGLVESILGKIDHIVVDLICHSLTDPVGNATLDALFLISVNKVLAFLFHDLGLFLGHGTAHQIAPTHGIARQITHDLHNLFLIYDAAIGRG